MLKIGWIGLGHMGMPMCKNLMKAGHMIIVNDIKKEVAQEILETGAKWADSPKEIAEEADYIFLSLPNGKAVRSVIMGANGIVDGINGSKIIIEMSTISAMESKVVSDELENKGCKMLRCPVTGSIGPAERGELGLLVSGDRDVLEEVIPMLNVLGKKIHYIGEQDESRVMKIALNTIVGNFTQLLAEAVTLAEKAGISVDTCMDVLADSVVASPLVDSKVKIIKEGKYDAMFSVRMMMKDFELAFDMAKYYQASLPVTALVNQFYGEMEAEGKGEEDYAVLVKRLETNVGIDR